MNEHPVSVGRTCYPCGELVSKMGDVYYSEAGRNYCWRCVHGTAVWRPGVVEFLRSQTTTATKG